MIIILKETKELSGRFVASFDDEHFLSFDLESWESNEANGLYGGEYIQIILPEVMNLQLDIEYDLPLEPARKIYSILVQNGWRQGKDFHK